MCPIERIVESTGFAYWTVLLSHFATYCRKIDRLEVKCMQKCDNSTTYICEAEVEKNDTQKSKKSQT